MNLGGFIDTFKDAIAKRVVESYPPLYRPSENGGTLPRLLRKPLGAQADAIRGAALSLKAHRGTTVVGEMGTGKTFIGAAAAYMAGFERILIICPPHLVPKWKREVEMTVPGVNEPAEDTKPLAVIIPAHNEAESLPDTLARIPRQQISNLQVIVVDDGSTDGTGDIARRQGADLVITHEKNRGLGAALRTGLEAARDMDARAAVYIDADGEYPPSQIPYLLGPIQAEEADYVLGSRYMGGIKGQGRFRRLGNLFFTSLLSFAAGRRMTDGQTGFRAFSRRALGCAEIIHDYNYAQVLTLDLLKKGMRMKEVSISYRPRTKGKSFINLNYLWRVPLGMFRQLIAT